MEFSFRSKMPNYHLFSKDIPKGELTVAGRRNVRQSMVPTETSSEQLQRHAELRQLGLCVQNFQGPIRAANGCGEMLIDGRESNEPATVLIHLLCVNWTVSLSQVKGLHCEIDVS